MIKLNSDPEIAQLQVIMLEILTEQPDMSMHKDLLIAEALKRKDRVSSLKDQR